MACPLFSYIPCSVKEMTDKTCLDKTGEEGLHCDVSLGALKVFLKHTLHVMSDFYVHGPAMEYSS